MNCPSCGTLVEKDSVFCENCGTKITIIPAQTSYPKQPTIMHSPKKRDTIYRSRKNRVIAGVCGGIGEYMDIDPNIVRLLFVGLTAMGGLGILIYIVAIVLLPESPYDPWKEPLEKPY